MMESGISRVVDEDMSPCERRSRRKAKAQLVQAGSRIHGHYIIISLACSDNQESAKVVVVAVAPGHCPKNVKAPGFGKHI